MAIWCHALKITLPESESPTMDRKKKKKKNGSRTYLLNTALEWHVLTSEFFISTRFPFCNGSGLSLFIEDLFKFLKEYSVSFVFLRSDP